jgi:hypothetical protein
LTGKRLATASRAGGRKSLPRSSESSRDKMTEDRGRKAEQKTHNREKRVVVPN